MMRRDLPVLIEGLDEIVLLPDGINLVRRTVLGAAIRGYLTTEPQTGAGEIDPTSSAPVVDSDTFQPWPVPHDWEWVPLGVVSTGVLGKMLDRGKNRGELQPYLRNTNVRWHAFDLGDLKHMRFEVGEEERYGLISGDVVICEGGEPGRAAVWDRADSVLIQKALHRVRCNTALNPYWLALVLDGFSREGLLAQYFTGIGIKHLTGASLRRITIPLPPRAEQDRLVSYVRDLFEALRELEDLLVASEQSRSALVAEAFERLGDGSDVSALGCMEELVQSVEDVGYLEQAVIELAVRGMLAPHTKMLASTDPLAGLRVETALDGAWMDQDSVQWYPLPPGWKWVPLGAVLTEIKAGWSPRAQARPKEGNEWGVLKVSACSWGQFRPGENKALAPDQAPRPELEVRPGDFLISRANTSQLVGRSVVVDSTPERLMLSDKTLRLLVLQGCNARYLNIANLAGVARRHYETEATGTSSSMKNVSQKVIRRTPIPLPPPPEQDRIVAAVDRLLAMVRGMRTHIAS